MIYRDIGTTGMKAGIIGLGAEHLDGKPYSQVEATIHTALDREINIMDLFMPGTEVRQNIGKAIAGRRDKLRIQGHIGSTDIGQQYDISRDLPTCQKYFENLLRDLGTDYIDFGMLFFIDNQKDFDRVFHGDILRYAQKLKRDGVIRAIGASSHTPETALKVVESGEIDLLMFSINPAFDMMKPRGTLDEMFEHFSSDVPESINPTRSALYRTCEERGVAITVMKTLGSAKLLSPDHTPFVKPLTVAQCVHYALTRPGVVSALVGCNTPEQVEEAVAYIGLSDEERDYADIISGHKFNFEGNCVYCSHCLPCPSGIDIAGVNRCLDTARLDEANIPSSIQKKYKAMPTNASDCTACGSCEDRCPFGVPVIRNMELAARLFE